MNLKSKSDAAQAVFSGMAPEESRARQESTDSWATVDTFEAAGAGAVSWHLECITNDVDARIVMWNGNSENPVALYSSNVEATTTVTAGNAGYVWAQSKGTAMALQIKSNSAGNAGVITARGHKA